MKLIHLSLALLLSLCATPFLCAEDAAPKLNELEAKFQETMNAATMSGRWCLVKDGAVGQERDEKYTIVSVAKGAGDGWTINARIRYGQQDIVAPIPVQVKWAGDTAVIIVNHLPVPGAGTYSARVLIHDGTYAGTWSGGDHGGLLNGVIAKTAAAKP